MSNQSSAVQTKTGECLKRLTKSTNKTDLIKRSTSTTSAVSVTKVHRSLSQVIS